MKRQNIVLAVGTFLFLPGFVLFLRWNAHEPYYARQTVAPHNDNTTFFVETSNATYLSERQSCAVQAAATLHSPHTVIVYMKSVDFAKVREKNQWIQKFNNLQIQQLNLDNLFSDSPVQKIYQSSTFQSGKFFVEHSADLARIALLKKFGGIYLDLDMILLKPVRGLGQFILRDLGNGIMDLKADTPLINVIYKNLAEVKYNPNVWIIVGGNVISSSVQQHCKLKPNEGNYEEASRNCNITFLDPVLIAPVWWDEWAEHFNKEIDLENFRPEKMQKALAIHIANHMTSGISATKKSFGLYNQIAKKFCPIVYETFPEIF